MGKISKYPAATEVTDADIMVIVQGNKTKKVTLDILKSYITAPPAISEITVNVASSGTVCGTFFLWDGGGLDTSAACLGFVGTHAAGSFVRFPALYVPKGATILSAIPKWKSMYDSDTDVVNVNLHFNNADNPEAPTGVGQANALALTDVVPWNAVSHWVSNNIYEGPDLKVILQAIIDRDGWVSGNSVQLVARDNASTWGAASRYGAGNRYFDIQVTYRT